MNPTVRLYGRVVGHGSHAQVTEGFAGALREAGLLAGLVAFDQDLPPDSPQPGGALAPHAVFTGPLGYLRAMRTAARHQQRYAMLAPNSSVVPGNLILALEGTCTEVLVPSEWAQGVVEELTSLAVHVVPHGVAAGFRRSEALRQAAQTGYRRGEFNVLHLSSSDRDRKGTRALVEAWGMLMADGALPSDAKLRLVLDMEALSKTLAWMAERLGPNTGTVTLTVRMDSPPARLAEVYGAHHVVCQPSRGEGFGMVPLEALASGVPIVATACTGHSQWFRPRLPGAVAVEHGPDAPIDDLPGAVAPTVEPDAIAAALRRAYTEWAALDAAAGAGAAALRDEWAWSKQLAPFVEYLRTNTEETTNHE
jgi:glycosyltransferase involved in cell wall biosynthesis